jgi:hypothetical protein
VYLSGSRISLIGFHFESEFIFLQMTEEVHNLNFAVQLNTIRCATTRKQNSTIRLSNKKLGEPACSALLLKAVPVTHWPNECFASYNECFASSSLPVRMRQNIHYKQPKALR